MIMLEVINKPVNSCEQLQISIENQLFNAEHIVNNLVIFHKVKKK